MSPDGVAGKPRRLKIVQNRICWTDWAYLRYGHGRVSVAKTAPRGDAGSHCRRVRARAFDVSRILTLQCVELRCSRGATPDAFDLWKLMPGE